METVRNESSNPALSKRMFVFNVCSMLARLYCVFVLTPFLFTIYAAGNIPESYAQEGSSIDAQPYFAALSVRNVDTSVAWYERVFGFEVTRSLDNTERGFHIRLLKRSGAFLELVENANAQAAEDLDASLTRPHLLYSIYKFGFLVENLDRVVEQLEALHVPLRGSVFTEADGRMRSLQVEDPDGNVIQIFEIL